ncbi:hypothetical protein MPSEU_000161000 [Mayamaea pseudoterrestris]|nr:hypothetical protein MPSEU_000161000 [Mayamaea pseudoterrestris]
MRQTTNRRRLALLASCILLGTSPSASWISPRIARKKACKISNDDFRLYHAGTRLSLASDLNSDRETSKYISSAAAPLQDVTMSLNELHTLLRDAAQRQDFIKAGRISNIFMERLYGDEAKAADPETLRATRRRMSWRAGAVPWLADRLDNLNYTFPTTIQINAMEAVQAIISNATISGDSAGGTTEAATTDKESTSSLSELVDSSGKDMGVVISGATGSGKTLSYLVPMLSALSDSLFKRQRVRVGAEERVGDATGNLLDRIALVTSPVVRSSSRRQQVRGAIATGASIATLGETGSDVTSPLSLIVVPTRELGVQTAMLLYQLVGGNIKESATQSSGKANSFKFKGPKGVRIGCVLDDEEAEFGLKLQTDVAITTPQYLTKLIDDGDVKPSMLRTIIFDEADLDLELIDSSTLTKLFEEYADEREYSRLTFLVGASVTKKLGNMAVSNRLIPEGSSYMATSTSFVPLIADTLQEAGFDEKTTKAASLTDLDVCMQPGLKHERAIYQGNNALLALTRLIRAELKAYDDALAAGILAQRPRVVVFFPDEDSAKTAIEPLRDALWGDHWLCVLLPKTGVRPLTIMDQFKRNQTSVMLATANSVRGLDFPALTHVYTMYLPVDDPREYVHLAGRVGRVGQQGAAAGDGAHVVSVLSEDESHQMDELAKSLGFAFTDIQVPVETIERTEDGSIDMENADVDKLRRYLEDAMTFSIACDDSAIDVSSFDVSIEDMVDDSSYDKEVGDNEDDGDEDVLQ